MSVRRGTIRHVARKQQINDFSGLRYGNITPTDIDGLIEYRGKYWIFIEVKYMDTILPFGQRLALERMVVDTSMGGKCSVAIVAEHNMHDVKKSVLVAGCNVREYYYGRSGRASKWQYPKQPMTVHRLIDRFFEVSSKA